MIIGPDPITAYTTKPHLCGKRDFGPAALTGPDVLAGMLFEWFDTGVRQAEISMAENQVRYYHMGEMSGGDSRPGHQTCDAGLLFHRRSG